MPKGYYNFGEWQDAMRVMTKTPKIERKTAVLLWVDSLKPAKKQPRGKPARHGITIERGGKVTKAWGLYTDKPKNGVLFDTPRGMIGKLIPMGSDSLQGMGYDA